MMGSPFSSGYLDTVIELEQTGVEQERNIYTYDSLDRHYMAWKATCARLASRPRSSRACGTDCWSVGYRVQRRDSKCAVNRPPRNV